MTVIEDDLSDSDTDSQDVAVSSGGGGGSTVTLLSSGDNNGPTWTANVWRQDGSALSGDWSTGATCTPQPTCRLSGIRKRETSVKFTSDSGETVTIFKP